MSTKAKTVGESTIRLMTRLCQQHNAVNLSQGFPNEAPPLAVRLALATSVLSGVPCTASSDTEEAMANLKHALSALSNHHGADVLNQYSPPMGRPDLREAIAKHYQTIYNYAIDPDTEITVTLGATEAFASALRTVGKPGDRVVIFEPFHELYPSQCGIFYMEPVFVTLREQSSSSTWTFDTNELAQALSKSQILVLNTPHNPTGKVFTHEELTTIVSLCKIFNVSIITDEIYEHMTYNPHKRHMLLPQQFPEIQHQVFLCNSIGKSASATGWRVGWCIHPPQYTNTFRGVHDQLVVMAPHPMQFATLTYLDLPSSYFTNELPTRYVERLKLLGDALREVGFEVPHSVEGAYYWMVRYGNVPALRGKRPMDAAMYMIETVGVGCVPGDNFYGTEGLGDEYLRFAACRSLSDVQEACRRMRDVLGVVPMDEEQGI